MDVEDCYSRDGFDRVPESLRRLRTDRIDLQQFHFWADSWTDQGQWADAVSALKNEGKVRFFGVSTNDHEPDSVLRLLESGLVDTVQVIYNLFDQSARERCCPDARNSTSA